LHEKLARAQSAVGNTRAPVPTLKGQDEKVSNNKVSYTSQFNPKRLFLRDVLQHEDKKKEDNQLTKTVKDRFVSRRPCPPISETDTRRDSIRSQKIAAEAQHGLISQILKDVIFSSRPSQKPDVSRVARLVDATTMIG
jgi:COP9 signalosome complex subunit 5